MVDMNIIKDLVDSVSPSDVSTNNNYFATVTRTDEEGVVWVQIAGAEKETPTAVTSAEVKKGDLVSVEWRNNKLYLAGNYTNPSAGITRVGAVEQSAQVANILAEQASSDASRAKEAADSAEVSAGEAKTSAQQAITDAATAGRAASVAQTAAEAAQATADTKKTVFITQPTPPYHVGDMWAKLGEDLQDMITSAGDNLVDSAGDLFQAAILTEGTIYVCTVPKLAGQTFAESDWELATADEGLREWFWHDADGAHVLGDETGFRNDITSTGMKIMDTSTEMSVAEFGSNGSTIGKTGETRSEIDYHSFKLIDKEGNTYFHISDFRDEDGYITESYTGNGYTTKYTFTIYAQPATVVVKVDDVVVTSGITVTTNTVTFSTAPASESTIDIKYLPISGWEVQAKAYTAGKRRNNKRLGGYSFAEGYNTTASGLYSHAEGSNTYSVGVSAHAEGGDTHAEGSFSHAEGGASLAVGMYSHAQNEGTVAASEAQTAMGKFNVEDQNDIYALIIGNGTADNVRSNALTVDWYGNVNIPTGKAYKVGGVSLVDLIYPVGSIYMSVNSTSPATLFGGTWQQIEDTFLLAAGSTYTAGNTGGSATHTLDESELPNITGTFYERRINASASNHMGSDPSGAFSRSNGDAARTVAWASSSTTVAQDQINMSFGSGNSHNNMPPYLAVYVWKRTV